MQSKTRPTPIGCGGFENFGKNAETSYYGVSAFMVWATTRVRPYGQIKSSDEFPDNYELCIMNYELKLIKRRTSVRLYDGRIHQLHVFPDNYELRIMNYELFSASLHTLHSLDRLDLLDHIVHLLKIVDEQ